MEIESISEIGTRHILYRDWRMVDVEENCFVCRVLDYSILFMNLVEDWQFSCGKWVWAHVSFELWKLKFLNHFTESIFSSRLLLVKCMMFNSWADQLTKQVADLFKISRDNWTCVAWKSGWLCSSVLGSTIERLWVWDWTVPMLSDWV